jgi:hypothetical protein
MNYWLRHLGNKKEKELIDNFIPSPALFSAYLLWNGTNLKDNIEPIEEVKFNELKNLEPKVFNYKKDTSNKKHYGFIAQEIEKVYPELVKDSVFGYKTVNYIELIPLLVSKINCMQKEIDELKEVSFTIKKCN